jgi:hypothetical protein
MQTHQTRAPTKCYPSCSGCASCKGSTVALAVSLNSLRAFRLASWISRLTEASSFIFDSSSAQWIIIPVPPLLGRDNDTPHDMRLYRTTSPREVAVNEFLSCVSERGLSYNTTQGKRETTPVSNAAMCRVAGAWIADTCRSLCRDALTRVRNGDERW